MSFTDHATDAPTDVHLTPDDLREALIRDVREGLAETPRTLPPTYFYDARGSALFEEITRLPEYYPTRAERAILQRHAGEIAQVCGADTLLELGSGSSEKTRLLLDALAEADSLRGYIPVDVSPAALQEAVSALRSDYPDLAVHGVVADFGRHLRLLPDEGRRLVAFLGGTIGNLVPDVRAEFLADLAALLRPGETLLLGTDLVKDEARLVAAYDDAAGVTAQFDRNVLAVLNREVGADFDPEAFEHVAVWDAEREWIEMRLRARSDQRVQVRDLGLVLQLAEGEEIRTEISAKFRREGVAAELAAAGFTLERWWADPTGDYALSLARR